MSSSKYIKKPTFYTMNNNDHPTTATNFVHFFSKHVATIYDYIEHSDEKMYALAFISKIIMYNKLMMCL